MKKIYRIVSCYATHGAKDYKHLRELKKMFIVSKLCFTCLCTPNVRQIGTQKLIRFESNWISVVHCIMLGGWVWCILDADPLVSVFLTKFVGDFCISRCNCWSWLNSPKFRIIDGSRVISFFRVVFEKLNKLNGLPKLKTARQPITNLNTQQPITRRRNQPMDAPTPPQPMGMQRRQLRRQCARAEQTTRRTDETSDCRMLTPQRRRVLSLCRYSVPSSLRCW